MIRFLIVALILSYACRVLTGKWPWAFLRPPKSHAQRVFMARKLLDVSADADAQAIREAHRRRTAILHPDRGGSTAAMQDLNAARDLLLAEVQSGERETDR